MVYSTILSWTVQIDIFEKSNTYTHKKKTTTTTTTATKKQARKKAKIEAKKQTNKQINKLKQAALQKKPGG